MLMAAVGAVLLVTVLPLLLLAPLQEHSICWLLCPAAAATGAPLAQLLLTTLRLPVSATTGEAPGEVCTGLLTTPDWLSAGAACCLLWPFRDAVPKCCTSQRHMVLSPGPCTRQQHSTWVGDGWCGHVVQSLLRRRATHQHPNLHEQR
jgi:hypothetical protein